MDIRVIWLDESKAIKLANTRGFDNQDDTPLSYVSFDEIEASRLFLTIKAAQTWAQRNADIDYWHRPVVSIEGERLAYDDPEVDDLAREESRARSKTFSAIKGSVMRLHDLRRGKGENGFCGPAVMSFVLGISTAETAATLRHVSGRRAITGTTVVEVREAFGLHGVRMVPFETFERDELRPTLAAWIKQTERPAGRIYLVVAGRHWQLITGRRYACGRIGEIVSITDKRVKRRARVCAVYVLMKGA